MDEELLELMSDPMVGYDAEVGFDLDDDDDDLAGLVYETAGEEVGRLFKRGNKKRRRRILGAIFGGPLGAIGALAKRRKEKKAKAAAKRAMALNSSALMRAAALQAPTRPKSLPSTLQPGYGRSVPLGLGNVSIAASSAGSLSSVCQRPMQPHRFVVSSDDTPDLLITDIKIGVRSQLAGVDSIPAAAFAANAEDLEIQFDPIKTGQTVTIDFLNLDAATATSAQAVMFGQTSEN